MLRPPLGDKPAVAMVGCGFCAEQAGVLVTAEEFVADHRSIAFSQKGEKVAFVSRPIAIGSVGVQNFWCGRQFRVVLVLDAEARAKEESQIIALGKSHQLGSVTQANVNDNVHASFLEEANKVLQGFLGVADGKDGRHLFLGTACGRIRRSEQGELFGLCVLVYQAAVGLDVHDVDAHVKEDRGDELVAVALAVITLRAHDGGAVFGTQVQ